MTIQNTYRLVRNNKTEKTYNFKITLNVKEKWQTTKNDMHLFIIIFQRNWEETDTKKKQYKNKSAIMLWYFADRNTCNMCRITLLPFCPNVQEEYQYLAVAIMLISNQRISTKKRRLLNSFQI